MLEFNCSQVLLQLLHGGAEVSPEMRRRYCGGNPPGFVRTRHDPTQLGLCRHVAPHTHAVARIPSPISAGFNHRSCIGSSNVERAGSQREALRPLSPSPSGTAACRSNMDTAADQLRSEFIRVLRSRRVAEVPLTVETGKPVLNPLIQGGGMDRSAMESCPRENITNFKERLVEENLYLTTEAGEQGRLPLLILSLKEEQPRKRPAIVFLHSSYKCKEWVRPFLEAYASRGYVCIAIDSRYHGERASNMTTYRDALVLSWKTGGTMPFIYDTVWDLIKLADYLVERKDIDPARIGITGESLGGMHAWFAAFADPRYAVAAPIIGVQGFRWALDNDKWQARVDSIKAVFEEARLDLGKSAIDKEVVEKVWNRIAPGLASEFDSPYTVPTIAPRPQIIINGAEDPRCPLLGLETFVSKATEAYKKNDCIENFKFVAEPGICHQMTPFMVKEASDWLDKFLK